MALFLLTLACLGAILASFAGVISERFNTGESWLSGRSRCNSCGRVLTVLDLVPVFSWTLAKGRCRVCHAAVPARYALSEAALAIVFAYAGYMFGPTLTLLYFLVAAFLLAVIVLYDLRHTVVPLEFALLFGAAALIFSLSSYSYPSPFLLVLLSATCIGGGFLLLHLVSSGRWMGLGDAPIAFALSLIAGTQAFTGLLFSFWIGGAIGVIILARTAKGHRMGIEVPFVPFLAAGYLLALFTQWNPLPF